MATVLDRILAQTRKDLSKRKERTPLEQLQGQAIPSDRPFLDALSEPGLSLIAELKRKSPSKGWIRPDCDEEGIEAIAQVYDRHATAISVLCDEPFFGGSHAFLAKARLKTRVPLLCKDFILEPYQIWEARVWGADAVLLMGSLLDPETIELYLGILRSLNMEALVEVHNEQELLGVLSTSARIIGINTRDLKDLSLDGDNFFRLAEKVPPERIRVAESGFDSSEAVCRLIGKADAVLIGSAIMGAPNIEKRIEELGW